jgi:hypothetical protein
VIRAIEADIPLLPFDPMNIGAKLGRREAADVDRA